MKISIEMDLQESKDVGGWLVERAIAALVAMQASGVQDFRLMHSGYKGSFLYHCRCGHGFNALNGHEGFRSHILKANGGAGKGVHGKVRVGV